MVLYSGSQEAAYALVAQLDRVFGYEPKGRGFESLQPYQERQSLRWLPFLFLFSASFRLEVLDNTALPCYSSAYQIGRTFVRRIATREVHRKKPQGLPKEQNSQVFPPGNEDCGWMWLWRSPPSGDAEGATRSQEHESLRQKDRVDRSDIRFRPDVFVLYFRAKP